LAKFLKILGKLVDFTLGKQKKFSIYTKTWDPFCFLDYFSHGRFPMERTSSPISPPSTQQPSLNQWTKRRRGPFGGPACLSELSCPGQACSRFKENKYNLKKPGDFTMSEGHAYPLVFIYNILGFVRLWLCFPSIRPVIHPFKFLILEEEDDGRGGGRRMVATTVYRNVYVIQTCSLWKTTVVLQFAKSYKLIFKN
jgi:hypothetical protein